MAAGYGTRLEPLTLAVPKPMVPIANKPTMQHNIELLRRHGIKRIIANIHYHPEQIVNYFSDGREFGVDLSYSYEEELMGTAGGVFRMGRVVEHIDETFVVLSSDALTDINLKELIKFHKAKKALATIALSKVQDVEQFGVLSLDENSRVSGFQEKPKRDEAKSNFVNAGIYVFEPEIFDMIPKGEFFDFGKQLFPKLIEENLPVFGYEMVEYWSDVGTLDAYIKANYDSMKGLVRVLIPGKKTSSCVWLGKNTVIDPSVKFEGCVIIGYRVEIKKGAVIKDAVIGGMSVIGSDVKVDGSIIWGDSFVSQGAEIKESVIGSWCRIGSYVKISEKSVLGNRIQIQKETVVPAGTVLKPREIL